MEKTVKLRYLILSLCFVLKASDAPPQAEISNGLIKAKILLPDTDHGYYRGTRFDWDGVVESLTYQGHNFFGKWFDHYEPTLHDAIMGPVEEFRTGETAIGYDDVKPGEFFMKIGVGLLKKLDNEKYSQFRDLPACQPRQTRRDSRKRPRHIRARLGRWPRPRLRISQNPPPCLSQTRTHHRTLT